MCSSDLTLQTGASALTVETLTTSGRGDISLKSGGSVIQSAGATPGTYLGTLTADELSIKAAGVVTLTTQANALSLTDTNAGTVTITQGTRDLVLNQVQIADGSLLVTAQGKVDLADVRLTSNKDVNDVTVTAAKDILVRYVSAGIFLEIGRAHV